MTSATRKGKINIARNKNVPAEPGPSVRSGRFSGMGRAKTLAFGTRHD